MKELAKDKSKFEDKIANKYFQLSNYVKKLNLTKLQQK